ncbi:MAG: hypothetical protein ABI723_19060 [Bacteroidia bacterium]
MINKINNIEELRAERIRLKQKRYELEDAMRNDFTLIKRSLEPRNIIQNGLSGITGNNSFSANDLLGTSLTMGINFLVSKVLLRRSGLVKKLVVTWLIRKYGVDFFEKNSDNIVNVIKNLVTKFTSKNGRKENFDFYDSGTVADDY